MKNIYRDITLEKVSEGDIGKTVRVAGWVENIRDHGGVSFVDLRDMYAVMQVVIRDGKLLEGIRKEQAISVQGLIEKRDEETYNPKIPTGTIELEAREIDILGEVYTTLPFEVMTSKEVREDVRLKYRYLDLRNQKVKENILPFKSDRFPAPEDDGAWFCGNSNANFMCVLAGRSQRLYRTLPQIQRKILRAAPGAAAV